MKLPRFVVSAIAGCLFAMNCAFAVEKGEEMKLWSGEKTFKALAPDPKATPPKDDDTLRIALVTKETS